MRKFVVICRMQCFFGGLLNEHWLNLFHYSPDGILYRNVIGLPSMVLVRPMIFEFFIPLTHNPSSVEHGLPFSYGILPCL